MFGSEHLAGVGVADRCDAARYHSPVPLRFVWHLILPADCGGTLDTANLVPLCDNCRASVLLMLAQITHGGLRVNRPNAGQLALARRGYILATTAGTLAKIPRP